ncbi:MAG: hypothetical protein M1598_00830, partial [Actinobacteria bacterium]|nr:hypothetical protein [Actinomycetota bacterium]
KIRASGITVLLIEHDMSVVMGISDRIVVLENGEKIAEAGPGTTFGRTRWPPRPWALTPPATSSWLSSWGRPGRGWPETSTPAR